jgi:hypothetical protein
VSCSNELFSVGLLTALLCARPGHADLLCSATGRASGRKVKVVARGNPSWLPVAGGRMAEQGLAVYCCPFVLSVTVSPNGGAYRLPLRWGKEELLDKCRAIVCNSLQSYAIISIAVILFSHAAVWRMAAQGSIRCLKCWTRAPSDPCDALPRLTEWSGMNPERNQSP